MLPPVRTGAFVGAGLVAVGGAAVADATGAVGGVVGEAGGSGLGATGGVTVGPGGSVGGCSGRGVLVGVGVAPEAAGEQELNTSPADTRSNKSAQRKRDLSSEHLVDISIGLQSIIFHRYRSASYAGRPIMPKAASSEPGWVTL